MRSNVLIILFSVFVLFSLSDCSGQGGSNNIAIAFYNCENFFDTLDNPLKEDDDFTPDGPYHYTQKVYEQKVHNIAAVLQSMGNSKGPAIIGLAEVENDNVLKDLVRQPEIARKQYKYVWFNGPDPRGINVALLYDPVSFKLLSSAPLHIDLTTINNRSFTRDVLYVSGILLGDTVHVFVNHWPSRRGEEDESKAKRAIAATVVNNTIMAIRQKNPNAKIILTGDFNDNPTDSSLSVILGAQGTQNDSRSNGLYNPWTDIYNKGEGTEVYKHKWNLFDQVIISGSLLAKSDTHHLHFDHAQIFRPGFITDHRKGWEGAPRRSFKGHHWSNGYSDHFPVILYLAR